MLFVMSEASGKIIKLVASLSERKHRKRERLFKVEGDKCVADTLGAFELIHLVATPSWLDERGGSLDETVWSRVVRASRRDIDRMSSLSTSPDVIAVYRLPEYEFDEKKIDDLVVALDGVQDPGNLGTIVRTCDWFGIRTLLCSRETVDLFNPKTVQATMGAIVNVRAYYVDLYETLENLRPDRPVFVTMLDGDNLFDTKLPSRGVIVMGNEGNGVSPSVASLATHRLTIPSFSGGSVSSESLNVAIATAITVAQFRNCKMR